MHYQPVPEQGETELHVIKFETKLKTYTQAIVWVSTREVPVMQIISNRFKITLFELIMK